MDDELREGTEFMYGDVDDETFLAMERLNHPDVVALIAAGTGGDLKYGPCPCPRCRRVRRVLAAEKVDPNGADAWPSSPAPNSVGGQDFGIDPEQRRYTVLDVDGDAADEEGVRRFFDEVFASAGLKRVEIDLGNGQTAFSQFLVDEPAPASTHDPRKDFPVATGVLAYFPDAIQLVAQVSKVGNDQHNPGEPMHWVKEKSTDEAGSLARHLLDFLSGEHYDTDGVAHVAKIAWRALALAQRWADGRYEDGYIP